MTVPGNTPRLRDLARPLLCFGCDSSLGGFKGSPAEKTPFDKHIHGTFECRRKALERFLRERSVLEITEC